jgi:hypothetical protein
MKNSRTCSADYISTEIKNENFSFGVVVALLEENVRQLLIIKPALKTFYVLFP